MIVDYMAEIEALLPHATRKKAEIAQAIAELPNLIKGYGRVKERNVERLRAELQQLKQVFSAPVAQEAAE